MLDHLFITMFTVVKTPPWCFRKHENSLNYDGNPSSITLVNITLQDTYTMKHFNDVIMSTVASQITSLTIVYAIVYSRADQRKHQSSASLAFVRGIHRWPVNSPHKWPVTRKMFPLDDVIMIYTCLPHERFRGSKWSKKPMGVYRLHVCCAQ